MPSQPPSPDQLVAALRPIAPEADEPTLRALARLLGALFTGEPIGVPGRGLDPLLEQIQGHQISVGGRLIDFNQGSLGDVTMRDTAGRDITYNIYLGVQPLPDPPDPAVLRQRLALARQMLALLEGQAAISDPQQLAAQRRQVAELERQLAPAQGGPAPREPNTLPGRAGVFIGRAGELEQCLQALDPAERGWGVAIDGLGGMGKTALAVEVAHQARSRRLFDAYLFVTAKTTHLGLDGVSVEETAQTTLASFVAEFARGLGLPVAGDPEQQSRALIEALRGRRALLIWDNLETLSDAERERVAAFLRRLPGESKAIVTSRRRTGESAATIRLDRLSEAEAVELMRGVGRGQPRVGQAIAAASVAERRALYEATGGNPLALHLSLGLIGQRGYSLAAAVARLADPARAGELHRFLFSDALAALSEGARTALVALATFYTPAIPADLAAASGLGAGPLGLACERLVALSLANDLLDGSLALHPLTRGFVRAALARGELSPAAERQALGHWVGLAERHGGYTNYAGYPTLEAHWPSLAAAAERLYEQSGLPAQMRDREAARLLGRLVKALRLFLSFSGRWDSWQALAAQAYAAALALEDWPGAFWRAYDVALPLLNQGRPDDAAEWVAAAAAAAPRAGRRAESIALRLRGILAERRGEPAAAQDSYEQALAISRDLGEEGLQAALLSDLGDVAGARGNHRAARGYYQQALAIDERRGDEYGMCICLSNLGLTAQSMGDPAGARGFFERGLALARRIGNAEITATCEHGLAELLEQEGRYAEALARAEAALVIRERSGDSELALTQALAARLRGRVRDEG